METHCDTEVLRETCVAKLNLGTSGRRKPQQLKIKLEEKKPETVIVVHI